MNKGLGHLAEPDGSPPLQPFTVRSSSPQSGLLFHPMPPSGNRFLEGLWAGSGPAKYLTVVCAEKGLY
jgi:hypothetical protein